MNGGFTLIGGGLGAGLGSLAGGIGAGPGFRIGATVGALLDGLTAKNPATADARWRGVTYNAPIQRGWGQYRTDGQIIWALRNTVDGSYIFRHDTFKSKVKGTVPHYSASFAVLVLETGFTFPDGTQVERPIVIDRIWMADKLAWQSSNAAPIPAWSNTTTYSFGDYVTRFGVVYSSIADTNLNEDPSVTSSNFWIQAQTWNLNINITPHPGPTESTFTQAVDSYIATHEGIANTPAYRGLTYFTVQDMDLYTIGNTIPQNISIEWHYASNVEDGDYFSDVCRFCGLSTSEFDFSAANGNLRGIVQKGRASGQELIASTLAAKAYDFVSIDGLLKAIPRGGTAVATINDNDLSACNAGEAIPDRLAATIPTDRADLHGQIKVGYYDYTTYYRAASAIAPRNNAPTQNPIDIQLELALSADEAAQIAGRLLDTEWTESGADFTIYLPGSYNYLAPPDCVNLLWQNTSTRFRVKSIEYLLNKVKAVLIRDEPQNLVRYEIGDSGLAPILQSGLILRTGFVIASPTVDLSDQFASYSGFYVWANGPTGWQGCQVWFTTDAPTATLRNWVPGPFISSQSVFGTVATALADASAPGYETTNHTNVKLAIDASMALGTNTQAAVTNGNSVGLLGSEILGVVVASQVSGPTWELGPGLIRGMRGSAFTGHAANETFAMALNLSSTTKAQVDSSLIGSTVYVQCLSPNQVIGDSTELSVVIAAPVKPYAPPSTAITETPVGTINGTNTAFTLSHTPITGTLHLYKNGSLLIPGTDYTQTGTAITMAVAPSLGATLYASYSYS